MITLLYALFVSSLKLTINQKLYEGDSFDAILESYGSEVSTINTIFVQEGYFPVNNLSNQYTNLVSLEVPAESFDGSIKDNLFQNMDLLKIVVINGAISIGASSFEGCTQLETVQFSSCTLIKSKAFQSCILLKNVQIPNVQIIESYAFSNTIIPSLELNFLTDIGDYGFCDCSLLTSFTAPLLSSIGSYCFKGTGFTSIAFDNLILMGSSGHCFELCPKLEIIELKNVSILTQYSFANCPLLHTVIGPKVITVQNYCFMDSQSFSSPSFPSLMTIGNYSFKNITAIKEINYPNVTSIGSSAFANCTELTTLIIESCQTIGSSAFYGCLSLTRVVAPEVKSISYEAFKSSGVLELDFPKLDTLPTGKVDGTSNVGAQFQNCKKLTTFIGPLIPSLPTWFFSNCESLTLVQCDKVSSIGNSFNGCTSLTSIILPNLKTVSAKAWNGNNNIVHIEFNSVTIIGDNAFQNCKNLESVSFKNCTTVGKYAFDYCNKLESVYMPNLKDMYARAFSYTNIQKVEFNSLSIARTDNYNYKDHGAQFEGCAALTHVTMKMLPYVQIEMFYNCHQLEFLDMPSLTTIYYRGFYLCNSLKNLNLPKLNSIGEQAFISLSGLTNVNLPSVTKIGTYAFQNCQNLVSFSAENCSIINNYAFDQCSKLREIYLPKLRDMGARAFSYTNLSSIELDSLVYTSTDNYDYNDHGAQFWCCRELTNVSMKMMPYIEIEMFVKCDKLQFIDIPNVNLIYKNAFLECESLANLNLPSIKTINSYAFQKLTGLVEINLPTLSTISSYAFENCANLVSFSAENCTDIKNYAFNACYKLENIYLPKLRNLGARAFAFCNFSSIELNSLISTSTDEYNYEDHGAQFQGCCRLKNVTMEAIGTIQIEMFYYCEQLININLPNAYEILAKAFMECHQLSNLTLPNLKTIGNSAFKSLTGLFEIDLPSLTSISTSAFRDCDNLISFSAQNCISIGESAFRSCDKLAIVHLENVTTILAYAFDFCSSLESINLPKLSDLYARAFSYTPLMEVEFNSLTIARTDNYNNKDHGSQFEGCKSLTHVTMNLMSYVQNEMFLNCNQLIYIDMPNLVQINYRGFYGCNLLNNLTFPSLSIIGEDGFRELNGLTEVNLPSITTIQKYAFYKCHNLVSFSSENCTYINEYAFYDDGKLEQIHLPRLRELGPNAFAYTNLTSIKLDSLVTAGTINYNNKNHGVQFQYCRVLKYASLKSMPYLSIEMFYYCTSLVEIDLPSCVQFNTNCLAGCSALKKATLGFESIQFGSIPSPQLLTHISFPNAKTIPESTFLNFKEMISCKLPLVSTIEASAFQGCLNLVDLELPSVIELIGDNNFKDCENLPSLSLRSLINVNSTSPNIFQGCRGLNYISLPDRPPKTFNRDTFKDLTCKIYIPADSIDIYDDDDSIDGDQKGDSLWCGIELSSFDMLKIIGDEQTGVGATLFDACIAAGITMSTVRKLKIVTGHLTQEEMISFKENFESLNELTIESAVSIEGNIIPQNFLLNHKEIKTIRIFSSLRIIDESAFQGCSQLSMINCPSVKELRSKCFFGPTSLEMISFELVDTLTGSHFFSNNSMLKTIELPILKTATLTGYISENSPLIASITLPETPPTLEQGKFMLDVSPYLIGISSSAAEIYDAADSVINDMHYFSLKLKYSRFLVLVDDETYSSVSLKNIIKQGANYVEIVQGEITEKDFPFPDSITSLTIGENVSLKSIPPNAFADNTNLRTINILSKTSFEIGEEAFSGCTALTYAKIGNATTLQGLAFKGCTSLKNVILNDVITIIGNSHFESCIELRSVSLQSLKTVPSTSSRIFLGCSKFSTISLPSEIPQKFNKNTFSGLQDQLSLVLPNEEDYDKYDASVSIEGDVKSDGLWCGIPLPATIIGIKINQRNNVYNGQKLTDCIIATGVSESQIRSLEIIRGRLSMITLIETVRNLPYLETLKVLSTVTKSDEFTDGHFKGVNLVSITLPSVTTIPREFFLDCTKLQYVEMNDATTICDSAFKGCTSLETISLNVNTFEGDSQFEGCISLSSVSVTNLVTVDPTAANIFSGCPLTSIFLPVIPPKTFNKNTFIGKNVIIYGLENSDLQIYDANTDVEDDVKDDLKWCGIDLVQLYLTVSINSLEPVQSSSLASAAESSAVSEVTSIEIQKGMVKRTHMNELKTFPSLTRITITETTVLESTNIEVEQFQDLTNLLHVKIMHNVTLMSNSFKGCSSLLSVEFAEVPLINEGSFRNCSSLNTIIIPNCKEIRGDYIFSGCSNLRDIDFSSLQRVDTSGSKIFEGCNQLTIIRLPSVEPLTFHKDTFIDCQDVKLNLPNKADYLAYDDESHVADDIKEDEKWCGIKIDAEFLPQFLIYKINNIEYRSRKLSSTQKVEDRLFLLEDNTTNTSDMKDLELIGGLVDAEDLKTIIAENPTIETFKANIGTLDKIASGTFDGCSKLREIIIEANPSIENGALQNIPSLEILHLDLLQTVRSDEFKGDINLQEVSIPILLSVPSDTFANLAKLKTLDLSTVNAISSRSFMNCESLETIDFPNLITIRGDSNFEGCTNLKNLSLTNLRTVPSDSPRIFMSCSSLEKINLGSQPPNRFNADIFTNAGVLPNISLPADTDWMNYIPQSTYDQTNDQYLWYGIDTGLTRKDVEANCPFPSECPEPSECSCPPQTECPTPITVQSSCPETPECPPPTECPTPPPQVSCPTPGPGEVVCPTPAECSCPEQSNIACPTFPQSPTASASPTPENYHITMSMGYTLTYVLRKSVIFSMVSSFSDIYSETIVGGEATIIKSNSYFYNLLPYVIRFYSLTHSPTYVSFEVDTSKKKITPEMLIGITCGSAAVFFIILAFLILYCRQLKANREIYCDYDFSVSDSEVMTNSNLNNINSNLEQPILENQSKNNKKVVEIVSDREENYW